MTVIPAAGNSYSYQNDVRSVNEAFMQLVSQTPTFLSIIMQGLAPINKKHEWLEEQYTPVQTAITSFDTDGDGTGITVTSTVGIEAGSLLSFATALDVSRTEIVQVTTVDSATELTVVRDYGSSTGVTLVVTDKVFLDSTPRQEGTDPVADPGQEADMNYNFTQIFDKTAKVSKTSEAIRMYGVEGALNRQILFQMGQMAYNMNLAAIKGRRVERTSSAQGSMGGVLQYMESGNIDTTGGAISATILNNLLEAIYVDGNMIKDLVILCNTNQARKISGFLTAANQPVIQKPDQAQQFAGFAINRFAGDLPANAQFEATVAVDPNFPKDQLAVLDMTKIEWNWLRTMTDENAAGNGSDYFARRLLGEVTLTVKNGKWSHGLATGLTV